MPVATNTKQVAHIDCAGGGQVWVDGSTLYVGHMRNPSGTSIYDIADPKKPALQAFSLFKKWGREGNGDVVRLA